MPKSKRRFNFTNWNAHSVLDKKQEIEAMLSLHDLDMLCVTETWLTPDFVFEFFVYLTFRCDRRLGRGDAALILIRNELAVTKMDLPIPYGDAFDAVGLSVCSPLGDLCAYLCLLTCPPVLPLFSVVTSMPTLVIGARSALMPRAD